MSAPDGPGVYYQTRRRAQRARRSVRTDIAGFVGIAERGPLDAPVPVEPWRQFVSWFGAAPAPATSPMRSAASSRTAGVGAGWSGSPPTTRRPGPPAPRSGSRERRGSPSAPQAPEAGATAWRCFSQPPGAPRRSPAIRRPAGPLWPSTRPRASRAEHWSGSASPASPISTVSSRSPTRRPGRSISFIPIRSGGAPTDRALQGLDPAQPVRIERLVLGLSVRRGGLPLAVYPRSRPGRRRGRFHRRRASPPPAR